MTEREILYLLPISLWEDYFVHFHNIWFLPLFVGLSVERAQEARKLRHCAPICAYKFRLPICVLLECGPRSAWGRRGRWVDVVVVVTVVVVVVVVYVAAVVNGGVIHTRAVAVVVVVEERGNISGRVFGVFVWRERSGARNVSPLGDTINRKRRTAFHINRLLLLL